MKFTYKRKIAKDCDHWEECQIENLRKGDIFYIMDGNIEGPFLTAESDAALKPSKYDNSKLIWHIETQPLSDENFS